MRKSNQNNSSTEATVGTPELLGVFLRKVRQEAGFTQAEAAGLCNVGTRFLNELEHGKSTAELGKVMQVMAGYGIHLLAIRQRQPKPKTT